MREVLAEYCALAYGAGVLGDGPGDAFTFRPARRLEPPGAEMPANVENPT